MPDKQVTAIRTTVPVDLVRRARRKAGLTSLVPNAALVRLALARMAGLPDEAALLHPNIDSEAGQ